VAGGASAGRLQAAFGFWMGVAGEQDFAPVRGRQMDVDHLDGGELLALLDFSGSIGEATVDAYFN
jgi:hypothetical protein